MLIKKDRLVDRKVNILSLFDLKAFIVANVPEFQCDWEKVIGVAKYTPYCQQCNKYKSGVSVIHNIKESNVGRRY